MRNTNDLTPYLIEITVSGKFIDVNNNIVPYRVLVTMPDCIDEYLVSNVKSRYIVYTIKQGKEYKGDKQISNPKYLEIASILTTEVEKNTRKVLNILPSFYNKSLFDLNEREIQDFATAFGLHNIKANENVEDGRINLVLSFLKNIIKMDNNKIKQLSFYRYDKIRHKRYFEFSEEDKKTFTIKVEDFKSVDVEEFREQDEQIKQGKKSVKDILDEYRRTETQLQNSEIKLPTAEQQLKNNNENKKIEEF